MTANTEPLGGAPRSLPAELVAEIAAAAQAWEILAASGQHVVFERADGELAMRLHTEGEQPRALSGTQLFELIDEHGGR